MDPDHAKPPGAGDPAPGPDPNQDSPGGVGRARPPVPREVVDYVFSDDLVSTPAQPPPDPSKSPSGLPEQPPPDSSTSPSGRLISTPARSQPAAPPAEAKEPASSVDPSVQMQARLPFEFAAPLFPMRKRIRLLILVPLLGSFACPYIPCFIGMFLHQFVEKSLGLPGWVAFGATAAIPAVALIVFVLLLYDAHRYFRSATVDRRGVLFGSSPIGTGTLIRWPDIQGFKITGDGVMLKLRGKRHFWTRYVGPIVFCTGHHVHEVVVLMEELEIYRLEED